MYEWGMIGLYLAFVACGYLFFAKGVSEPERLWGMISLVVLCITPLGSNNYTYKVWVKGSEVASFNNTSFYYLNSNKAYQVTTDNVTELDDTPYHLKKKYRTSNDPEAWFFNSELYADGFEEKLSSTNFNEITEKYLNESFDTKPSSNIKFK